MTENWKDHLITDFISILSYNFDGIEKLSQASKTDSGIMNLHMCYARQLSGIAGEYKQELKDFIGDAPIPHMEKDDFFKNIDYLTKCCSQDD